MDSAEEIALAEELDEEDSEYDSDTDEEYFSDVSSDGIGSPRRPQPSSVISISSDDSATVDDNSLDSDYNE